MGENLMRSGVKENHPDIGGQFGPFFSTNTAIGANAARQEERQNQWRRGHVQLTFGDSLD